MADSEFDMRAHRETYAGVMKLTTFTIAALIVIVVGMALGLIAKLPLIGFGGMIFGLVALTFWAMISD
jgi:hypothetical protein